MKLSVIIPTLNEEKYIGRCVVSVRSEYEGEIIVVDAGSVDRTVQQAQHLGAKIISSDKGLARQCNLGTENTLGEVYLFLSADCVLCAGWYGGLEQCLLSPYVVGGGFSLEIEDPSPIFRWIAWGGNFRSRLAKIALPDQGLFVRGLAYRACGGMAMDSLIPFARLSKQLQALGEFVLLSHPTLSSPRKWRSNGILPVTWKHSQTYLRFCYAECD